MSTNLTKMRASKGFNGAVETEGYDYLIEGDNTPYITFRLDPDMEIIGEPGSMMAMTGGIDMRMVLGNASDQGIGKALWSATSRYFSGDDFLMSAFRNAADSEQTVMLAAPRPGEIIPIDLREAGGSITCQRGAFLASTAGTDVKFQFRHRIRSGFFGGEGFVFQRITGDDYAFLHAGGNYKCIELGEGDSIKVDTGSVVAFSQSVDMNVQVVKGVSSMLFGDEGLFLTTLQGPGHVWLQSMPFQRQVSEIADALPKAKEHKDKGWMRKALFPI